MKQTNQTKRLLFLLIFEIFIAVLMLGGLVIFAKIVWSQYQDTKTYHYKLAQVDEKLKQIQKIKKEFAENKELIDKTINFFPVDAQSKLITEAEQLSQKTGCEIIEIKFQEATKEKKKSQKKQSSQKGSASTSSTLPSEKESQFILSVQGNFLSLYNFIKGLLNMPMFLNLQNITLNQANPNDDSDYFTLSIDGFYIVKPPKKASAVWPTDLTFNLNSPTMQKIKNTFWPSQKTKIENLPSNPFLPR